MTKKEYHFLSRREGHSEEGSLRVKSTHSWGLVGISPELWTCNCLYRGDSGLVLGFGGLDLVA